MAEKNFEDPLKKREEFAVSLRKKKKQEILNQKRIKLHQKQAHQQNDNSYSYCTYFSNLLKVNILKRTITPILDTHHDSGHSFEELLYQKYDFLA